MSPVLLPPEMAQGLALLAGRKMTGLGHHATSVRTKTSVVLDPTQPETVATLLHKTRAATGAIALLANEVLLRPLTIVDHHHADPVLIYEEVQAPALV